METNDLLNRLQRFAFETGTPKLSFAKRLARDNGWTTEFARRAIEEYLKFVYLCATGSGVHTPSDVVDQVWHLHLIYTRSYWEDLCRDTLGTPLHHQPTRGGTDQGARWTSAYQHTVDRYTATFGTPPADIWPATARRFSNVTGFRRINTARYWLLPKPAGIAVGGATALGLSTWPAYAASDNLGISLIVGLAVVVGIVIFLAVVRNRDKSGGGAGCGAGGGNTGSNTKGDSSDDGGDGCGGGCGGCGG